MVVKNPSIGSNHSTSSRSKPGGGNSSSSKKASPSSSPAATATALPLSAAESQDVDDVKQTPPSSSMNIFQQLLYSMNPVQCLSPSIARCSNPLDFDDDNDNNEKNRPNFEKEVPPLLKDLEHEGKLRTMALQKLYRMTDKDNQKNRVPVVCSESFDTLRALLPCLSPSCAAHDRRQALLLLNNLCIPMENKRYILSNDNNDNGNFGAEQQRARRDEILPVLLRIFKKRLAESFLSAACLFNLSFYEEGKHMLLNYIPPYACVDDDDVDDDDEVQSGYKCHKAPSDNEKSLLRVVEALLMDFTPYLQKQMEHELKQQQQASPSSPRNSSKPVSTVEAATTRWCIAMLRNLATVPENAQIIATTTAIPLLTAHCLIMSTSALPRNNGNADDNNNASSNSSSSNDLSHWARDSLEDSSLMLLLWLSQCGSQGLGSAAATTTTTSASFGENNKPVDLDESIATASSANGNNSNSNNGNGNHSVTSVEQQSALEALDLPVIRQALQGIQNKPGIHGVRAKVILQRMNEVSSSSGTTRAATATPPTNAMTPQGHENSSSRSTSRNVNHRQRSMGAGSQMGVDNDVVQEIIKTVESQQRLQGKGNGVSSSHSYGDDDDDNDRMRVDDITLASF